MARAFGNIAEFVDVKFVFLGYFVQGGGKYGYENAAVSGSDMNITYSYAGYDSLGKYFSDGKFSTTSATAFCYFPDSKENTDFYNGAPGDTWLNYNNPFIKSLNFDVGTNGFALLTHELLHGLGLKHPHDDGSTGRPTYASLGWTGSDRQWVSVMSYDKLENGGDGAYKGSMPIGPMINDAIALQYLYGESTFNAGDTTYDLARYIGNYYNCQWDYSGVDTLDGTNLAFGIVVELATGTATNGYRTHDIGIITTATDLLNLSNSGTNPTKWTWLWGEYENVTGTSYVDVISGNELNNDINGGAGNDYMEGGLGNDRFDWSANSRAGEDKMVGGPGNDTYVVNSVGDELVENISEGADTVWVSFSASLSGYPNVENLRGYGSANLFLSGSGFGNLLSGAGGNDTIDGGTGTDTAKYSANATNYSISKSVANGVTTYTVKDKTGAEGIDTLTNVEVLSFADKTINLTIQSQVASAPAADVSRLSELYVAFFNRIPDADGLSYWIGQKLAGQSISQIADAFYSAGVQYSSLTGFSSTMSNADFVNVVYKNVLGRKDGADAGGLTHWSGKLADGSATHGSLVSAILDSAHTFKGDSIYGYVADLLDNKVSVAKTFAVDWGLNYNTSADSISNGMAIAAAVTPTSTAVAISLIGVSAADLHIG
jgi:Ca2+-binding RTX toxin-like protein